MPGTEEMEFWNSECLKAVSCSDEGDAFDSKGELGKDEGGIRWGWRR